MRVMAPPLSTYQSQGGLPGWTPILTHKAFQQLHIQLPEDLTDQRTYLGPQHRDRVSQG